MRTLRILVAGATYIVTSEINRWEQALKGTEDKEAFLVLLETAKKKFNFELYNFNILDDHIEFIINPGEDISLSKIMQWIKCNYTKKWNKMHNTKGHLWGNRFHSEIIENKEDFAQISACIDNSAVRAGLVKEAADWKFGGLFRKLRGIIGLVDELLESGMFFPTIASQSASRLQRRRCYRTLALHRRV
jgi:putative transposase